MAARNFWQTFRGVIREEGVQGFYKGCPPAVMRQLLNSGLALFMYKPMRNALAAPVLLPDGTVQTASMGRKLIAASVASACGQFLSNPFDVLKVRLQADGRRILMGEVPQYHGTIHAFQTTWARDGPMAFWRGCLPAAQRSALVGGIGLSMYDQSKDVLQRWGFSRGSTGTHVAASAFTGIITALVSVPLDVVKVYQHLCIFGFALFLSMPIFENSFLTFCYFRLRRCA